MTLESQEPSGFLCLQLPKFEDEGWKDLFLYI